MLERLLGQGGMGQVWLAQDETLHESVALKFISPLLRTDATAIDALKRETAKARKLHHPHIVGIYEFHAFPGELPFVAMEYVAGRNLAELRCDQPNRVLRWATLRPWVQQLCEALHYAHLEGVIHRDLKPGNLMLDGKERLKLADFGIAAVVHQSVNRVSVQSASSGTPAYMSLQQLQGERPAVTDDVYSLGATLYELLTSEPPYTAHPAAMLAVMLEMPVPPLAERLQALGLENPVPADVCAVLLACLDKAPEKRPPSAKAVWEQLENAEGKRQKAEVNSGSGVSPVPGVTPPVVQESPKLGLLQQLLQKFLPKPKGSSALAWRNSLGMPFVPVSGTTVRFCIWPTRVQDYRAFVAATQHPWLDLVPPITQSPTHPAVMVNWEDAQAFCKWLTRQEQTVGNLRVNQYYRLPTDAEWSVAVGLPAETGNTPKEKDGQIAGVYPWGQEWPAPPGAGQYLGDGTRGTVSVGRCSPNQFGLYDLGGNVWEWCEDLYDPPKKHRVQRGASWNNGAPKDMLSSHRNYSSPTGRVSMFGFRVVLAETLVDEPAKAQAEAEEEKRQREAAQAQQALAEQKAKDEAAARLTEEQRLKALADQKAREAAAAEQAEEEARLNALAEEKLRAEAERQRATGEEVKLAEVPQETPPDSNGARISDPPGGAGEVSEVQQAAGVPEANKATRVGSPALIWAGIAALLTLLALGGWYLGKQLPGQRLEQAQATATTASPLIKATVPQNSAPTTTAVVKLPLLSKVLAACRT